MQKSVRKKATDILIQGTLQQEDITILNIYVPNIRVPTFIKKKKKKTLLSLKDQVGPDTIIVGDLNTPLSFKRQNVQAENPTRYPRTKQYH
jgi:hypothetical protein